jgi:hypothetical protein
LISLEYLAGLVDGEGCIRLASSNKGKYKKYYPRLQVTNTYKPICDTLVLEFGGAIHIKRNKNPNWKTGYDWRLSGDAARNLIKQLEPLLIIKKEDALKTLAGDEKRV